MILAQFIGAAIGALLAVLCLYSLNNPEWQGLVVPELMVLLCPIGISDGAVKKGCDTNNDRHLQAFLIQVICTFAFIFVVLITKGKNTCAPSKDTVNAAIACGGSLYALILVAKTGGPCFNPAIGVVLTVYQYFMFDIEDKSHLY